MSHIYCPECGFQSPEAASYCARCGALLVRDTTGETTVSLGPDELEAAPDSIDGPGPRRPLRRWAGGRELRGDRRPRSDRPLARVRRLPRRRHRLTTTCRADPEGNVFTIRDLGSLNGTFVNKHRIESSVLEDDDEVQIGKYRMTFLRR